MSLPLPLAGPSDHALAERADAARNRERILKVAAALVERRGIEAVSMQEIAREACVGTGTVYRRFGDRAGLALALLQNDAAEFQAELLGGAPPLGPGAPPLDRLRAFGVGYLEQLEQHAALILAGERVAPDERGPESLYLTHIAVLLREACPSLDAEYTARVLWAALSPRGHLHMRGVLGWSAERLQRGWAALVDGLGQPTASAATTAA